MTQANNRHGADWPRWPAVGERRTEAERLREQAGGPGSGPGTESNRARAARGGPGPDVLSVYLDGQRIAGVTMDRVEVGVDHASGPDFTMRTRMTVREDADGVRRWEALPPMTWGGVAVPFERVDAVRAAAPPQPDPAAPAPVWAPPPSRPTPTWTDADGTVTIADLSGGFVRLVGGASVVPSDLCGWTCIGVATPHGRVMVGDGFRASSGIQVEVTGVGPGDLLVRGSQEPTRERFTLGHAEAATLLGWTRTRYAPARAGERLRCRESGAVIVVVPSQGRINQGEYAIAEGERADPAQWERLDTGARDDGSFRLTPEQIEGVVAGHMGVLREHQRVAAQALAAASPLTATGEDLDQQARIYGVDRRPGSGTAYRGGTDREMDESLRARCVERLGVPGAGREPAFDYGGNIKGPPSYDVTFEHPRCRSVLLGVTAPPTLTLQAPARDLRALFDAIGRALELPATRHACPFGAGLTVTVLRDEMLFTPTAETGIGTADLAGDARGLCALRSAVSEAMTMGAASLPQWGAKGPRVEVVRREGGGEPVAPAERDPSPTRYDGANGGADQWRWAPRGEGC